MIIVIAGIALDQWTKKFMTQLLKDKPAVPIITDILELDYVENRGAAFGMLQGKRIYFIIISIVVFFLIVWLLLKLPSEKKYRKLHIALSFILAGAMGNTIDRGLNGYVVDFIYFKIIDFPVFNVADIFITVTTLWLAILILFFFKEEDFDFLRKKKVQEKDTENK
ncbi:MAG: signal peptidase II [Lachnospiraceae bacterium]|nr:signal peptidase II [Lachnospiraceae bacterium]